MCVGELGRSPEGMCWQMSGRREGGRGRGSGGMEQEGWGLQGGG